MSILTQKKRYLPHTLQTRVQAVCLYRKEKDIGFVCRRYHISKSSLMRWNKRYDGTEESLSDRFHKPFTSHPNRHTEEELDWIKAYLRRSPHISANELYGKLRRDKGYKRHPGSLYRILQRLSYRHRPPKKRRPMSRKPMIRQKIWEKNGKWTCNMFPKSVIREIFR